MHCSLHAGCLQIKEYCFEQDGFTDTFNEWSAQNAHNIDLTMDFTENKLEYTEMHREVRAGGLQNETTTRQVLRRAQFTALFEKRLEKRVIAEGLTVDEFYDWLKADLEEDAASNNAFVVRAACLPP